MRTTRHALYCSLLLLAVLSALTAATRDDIRSAVAGGDQAGRSFLPLAVGRPAFSATPLPGVFKQVTAITHAGDDRLFVGEREGRVKIIHPDGRVTVFLDLRHRVMSHRGEYGFYDIAFHPGYADPTSPGFGFFYASFASEPVGRVIDSDLVVSRFRVSANPDIASAASEVVLLAEPQTDDIHKGGSLDFDPRDNRLYVGVGDDFKDLIAQDNGSIKGKIVRLAVDQVPRDMNGGRRATVEAEVWAAGLRNPWRLDVDAPGDQIIIGDVGDSNWEEVNRAPLSAPGTNFGWPCLEGTTVKPEFAIAEACQNPAGFEEPIHEYSHRDEYNRCVVIGGNVYRPSHNPGDGRYIFADMCSREVFTLGLDVGDGNWRRTLLGVVGDDLIITLGEDRHGIQYVGTASEAAPIYRLFIP